VCLVSQARSTGVSLPERAQFNNPTPTDDLHDAYPITNNQEIGPHEQDRGDSARRQDVHDLLLPYYIFILTWETCRTAVDVMFAPIRIPAKLLN
jgi:hypothetical protein